ncbi:MAG: hypothetical protein HYW47_04590 [Deltaproteobacteria bacterium]|nr:hypothetical protein [Deltaproteobacteria bacterium]
MKHIKVFLLVVSFIVTTNLAYSENIDLSGLARTEETPLVSDVVEALDAFLATHPEESLSREQNRKLEALRKRATTKVTEATQELTSKLAKTASKWMKSKNQKYLDELEDWASDVDASDFEFDISDVLVVWNRAQWKDSHKTIAYVAFGFLDLEVTGQFPDDAPGTKSTRDCRFLASTKIFTSKGKEAYSPTTDDQLLKARGLGLK